MYIENVHGVVRFLPNYHEGHINIRMEEGTVEEQSVNLSFPSQEAPENRPYLLSPTSQLLLMQLQIRLVWCFLLNARGNLQKQQVKATHSRDGACRF